MSSPTPSNTTRASFIALFDKREIAPLEGEVLFEADVPFVAEVPTQTVVEDVNDLNSSSATTTAEIPPVQPIFTNFQMLPLSVIDEIVQYFQVDKMGFGASHNCLYEACVCSTIEHNKDLLHFSQVCRRFREVAIPRLWEIVKVNNKNVGSLDRLIWTYRYHHPELMETILNSIKYIHYDVTTKKVLQIGKEVKWIKQNRRQPFGMKVIGQVQAAKGLKQAIYLMRTRNLKNLDFYEFNLSGNTKDDAIYNVDLLIPFWLCVSKTSKFVEEVSIPLKDALESYPRPREFDWALNAIQNLKDSIQEEIGEAEETEEAQDAQDAQDAQQTENTDDNNRLLKVLRILIDNEDLRREVERLYWNDWFLSEAERDRNLVFSRLKPVGCPFT